MYDRTHVTDGPAGLGVWSVPPSVPVARRAQGGAGRAHSQPARWSTAEGERGRLEMLLGEGGGTSAGSLYLSFYLRAGELQLAAHGAGAPRIALRRTEQSQSPQPYHTERGTKLTMHRVQRTARQ